MQGRPFLLIEYLLILNQRDGTFRNIGKAGRHFDPGSPGEPRDGSGRLVQRRQIREGQGVVSVAVAKSVYDKIILAYPSDFSEVADDIDGARGMSTRRSYAMLAAALNMAFE